MPDPEETQTQVAEEVETRAETAQVDEPAAGVEETTATEPDVEQQFRDACQKKWGVTPEQLEARISVADRISREYIAEAGRTTQAAEPATEPVDLDEPMTRRDAQALQAQMREEMRQSRAQADAQGIHQSLLAALQEHNITDPDDQADVYHAAVGRMQRARGGVSAQEAVNRILASREKGAVAKGRKVEAERVAAKKKDQRSRGETADSGSAATPKAGEVDVSDDALRLKETERILAG